jgi:signal transduction histidine kinase
LQRGLRIKDRNIVHARQNELSAILETEGIEGLKAKLHQANEIQNNYFLLVRVLDKSGQVLFNQMPQRLTNFTLARIETSLDQAFSSQGRYTLEPDNFGQETIELVSGPVLDKYVLITGFSTEQSEEVIGIFLESAIVVALGSILVSVLFGYYYSKNALKPIRSLIRIIQEIQRGSTRTLVPESDRKDELSDLIDLFNKMILQINQLIDSLQQSLDSIAHDLRTPITHLINRFEATLNQQSNSLGKEFLHESLEEVQAISSLLTTLLEISEAQSGSIQIEKNYFPLRELFDECQELYEYVAEEKNATIEYMGPDLKLFADRHRFKRILANLLDNALKYADAGVRIVVSSFENGSYRGLRVTDSGWGIAETDLHKIWQRLYRGDSSRSSQGMGLGLSFVKSIVELHGGEISVSSHPGQGSTFEIGLPKERDSVQGVTL